MTTEIVSETEKIITADEGKVLSNGGEFAQYPIQLVVNIEDTTWFEMDDPIEIIE